MLDSMLDSMLDPTLKHTKPSFLWGVFWYFAELQKKTPDRRHVEDVGVKVALMVAQLHSTINFKSSYAQKIPSP